MKSIFFFTYDLNTGGTEKVVVYLANYFSERNYRVTLLTVSSGNDLKKIIGSNINLVSLGERKVMKSIIPLIKFIKKTEVDYFVSNIWPLTLVASCIQFFSRKTKILLIEHSVLSEEYKNRNFLFKYLQNISLRIFHNLAHQVVVVSSGIKEDLIKKGVRSEKISVIHNPIYQSNGQKIIKYPPNIESWLDTKSKKIINVGRLKEVKNLPNLVKAISCFQKKFNYQLKVLILGEGEERRLIEDLISQEGLEENILLPGQVDDPMPFLEKADLFVLSSDYEGFGLVIAEALSVGLNVVSTDCLSGPREILNDGEYGFLCKVNDPVDLASTIKEALDNPKDMEKLVNRSKDFSIDVIGRQYKRILEEI